MSSVLATHCGDRNILVDVLVRALSRRGPELGLGAPPCTFRRTPKRNGADCPAGGSSLIITGPRSWWNAMLIWSGSGARKQPRHSDQGYGLGSEHPNRLPSRRLARPGRLRRGEPEGPPRSYCRGI